MTAVPGVPAGELDSSTLLRGLAGHRRHAAANRLLTDHYGPTRVDPARMKSYLHLDPLTWS